MFLLPTLFVTTIGAGYLFGFGLIVHTLIFQRSSPAKRSIDVKINGKRQLAKPPVHTNGTSTKAADEAFDSETHVNGTAEPQSISGGVVENDSARMSYPVSTDKAAAHDISKAFGNTPSIVELTKA